MNRDIRQSELYQEVEDYFRAIHAPGDSVVSDAADVCVEPNGQRAALTGTIFKDLASSPITRICLVELGTSAVTVLPCPDNSDRLPRWSPDGEWLAFLSDRRGAGNHQLYLARSDALDQASEAPPIDGLVEYLRWSPDGTRVLLGVAGFGADLAGCQGGGTIAVKADELPDWMPEIDTGDAENLWRSIYVHELASGKTEKVSREGLNYWEATWLGNDAVMSVVSDSHSEGSWYQSKLIRHDLDGANLRPLFVSEDQLGWPAASPSGRYACIVEAVCSDRMIVCGTLKLIDTTSGKVSVVDTDSVEVTHTIWRDDDHLLYAGQRGFDTVVAEYSVSDEQITTHWCGTDRTIGDWYPSVWPAPNGAALGIGESYDVAPELVELSGGKYKVLTSFASKRSGDAAFSRAGAEPVTWMARDGLEIQGWLVRPEGDGPFPLVVDIHGGPVWQCRNRWVGRLGGAKVLADHGIASLYPNPRGSSGRGQDFARLVKGDMGGEDTYDYLTGCDAMVEQEIADPDRLGVTGISYGGFMSAWLITQDDRFAAAVPISCVANWYSQHRTSQIPFFDELFLADSAYKGGKFFDRSPAMLAANVKTPTLQLTGRLDQSTPPTQALEFHRSLLEQGVESVLATYPTATHGVRTFPEVVDATTRYIGWFLDHFELKRRDS